MIKHPAILTPHALVASLVLSACQTTAAPTSAIAATEQAPPPAFVEAACGGCHAVEPPFLSPNPAAPSFAAIANREGLTRKTIKPWLMDAHNYPEVMDFELKSSEIDQVARYMITLQREDYVPDP